MSDYRLTTEIRVQWVTAGKANWLHKGGEHGFPGGKIPDILMKVVEETARRDVTIPEAIVAAQDTEAFDNVITGHATAIFEAARAMVKAPDGGAWAKNGTDPSQMGDPNWDRRKADTANAKTVYPYPLCIDDGQGNLTHWEHQIQPKGAGTTASVLETVGTRFWIAFKVEER